MKRTYLLFLPVLISAQYYNYINGLEFPSNGDEPAEAFIALQFDNPQDNGLPIWGPNHEGVTWIWEIKPRQQSGYYVTFWWANGFSEDTYIFLWDNGKTDTYYGAHPYPQNESANGTNHWWSISGTDDGADIVTTNAGDPLTVVKDEWYLQAFQVDVNPNGSKHCTFFIDLPDISSSNIIQATATAGFGEKMPPNPKITFGDAPWHLGFQHERLSGILGRVKIIDTVMTDAEILLESADMNQLVTDVAKRNIWWGINNFENVDDLTCDYGTGRTFYWADSLNKADTVVIDSIYSDTPLAVQLKSFSAQRVENRVIVRWKTSSEINNLGFEIYRSEDIDASYKLIASYLDREDLKGSGSTSQETEYLFIDDNVTSKKDYWYKLTDVSRDGYKREHGPVRVGQHIPAEFSLHQNYPNPFNSTAVIRYKLPIDSNIDLSVYNLLGQKMITLVAKKHNAGDYSAKFNATDLPSGVYIYRLTAGNFSASRKMILRK